MSGAISNGIFFQHALYIGNNLQSILYGVQLVLYIKTMHLLLGRGAGRKRSDLFYAFFSTMMCILETIWIATQAIMGEEMWISNGDYPGGPSAYWTDYASAWYMTLGTTAVVLLQLMTDGLMIYRCFIVWDSPGVVVVPSIVWLLTLGLGITVLWISGSPNGNFFGGLASHVGLAYYATSILLNTIVTTVICYRVVYHGMKIKRQLGPECACTYFDVATVIIESVLPYTVSGLAFVVSFGVGSALSITFGSVYLMFMSISPQMLILRVIMGRAWHRNTGWPHSTGVKFSPRTTNSSTGREFEESAAAVHLQVLSNVYLAGSQEKV
ncbi:hypothetical protein F5I97DRAFT_1933774 [Phlebopus sp. FC_14]|nr:hypothetical protein F5I97DRAFT_1933774 [Phlebopus sp. FC_14]